VARNLSEAVVRAWTRLMRAQSAALLGVETDLKAAGFPPLAWYDVLLELSRHDGLRPFEIETRVLLAQYNLSRLLDRLAAAGYVERRPCPDDKRGQIIVITPAGRDLQKRMWPSYRSAIARHVGARLSEADAETLGRLLEKLIPARTSAGG